MFKRRYFVVAPNFHGATIFSRILNDHPNVVCLGDTYPSNHFDQTCGCGKKVKECEFWQKIKRDIDAERYISSPHILPDYPRIVGGGVDRFFYNTFSPGILRRLIPRVRKLRFKNDFDRFVGAVYQQVDGESNAVYVDGVKSISRVYALLAAGVRIDGVIHIQRDPGDYIKSTMKQYGYSRRVFMKMLLSWRLYHNLARKIGTTLPYLSVTYEGLAKDPESTLNALFDFLEVPAMPLSELMNQDPTRPWHFMGNASLFQFDGKIKRSRHSLSTNERKMVRLLAGDYDWNAHHLLMRKG